MINKNKKIKFTEWINQPYVTKEGKKKYEEQKEAIKKIKIPAFLMNKRT